MRSNCKNIVIVPGGGSSHFTQGFIYTLCGCVSLLGVRMGDSFLHWLLAFSFAQIVQGICSSWKDLKSIEPSEKLNLVYKSKADAFNILTCLSEAVMLVIKCKTQINLKADWSAIFETKILLWFEVICACCSQSESKLITEKNNDLLALFT